MRWRRGAESSRGGVRTVRGGVNAINMALCVRVGVGEERALPAERLFVNKDHFVLLEHQPGEMCCCCEVSSEAVGINSWNSHPKHQRIKIVCVDIYWRQLNMHNSIGGEYKTVKYVQRNELQQFVLGNFHHTLRPMLIGILSPLLNCIVESLPITLKPPIMHSN